MDIEIVDAVVSKVSTGDFKVVRNLLKYTSCFYKQVGYEKKRMEYPKYFHFGKRGKQYLIPTGFVPKIVEWCNHHHLKIEVYGEYKPLTVGSPNIDGVKLRKDQIGMVRAALEKQRGVIVAPTGTGKTILQVAICMAFSEYKVIMLAHTIDLIYQTANELSKYGLSPVVIGGKFRYGGFGDLTVSTIQSFSRIDPSEYREHFDAVIIDECHHVSSATGKYATVLEQLKAPVRLGFTATMPSTGEGKIVLEGLVGPVIKKLTINEAAELNLLARPRMAFLKSSMNHEIKEMTYQQAIDKGIVNNAGRNRMIANQVEAEIKAGRSVLIFVNKIEHMENLVNMLESMDVSVAFVRGDVSGDDRKKIKYDLDIGKTKCVISTSVWREGINIPSLNTIILADTGKSYTTVIQEIGRGLRNLTGKGDVIVYDIFDPSSRYFVDHFGHRLSLYFENGWL